MFPIIYFIRKKEETKQKKNKKKSIQSGRKTLRICK